MKELLPDVCVVIIGGCITFAILAIKEVVVYYFYQVRFALINKRVEKKYPNPESECYLEHPYLKIRWFHKLNRKNKGIVRRYAWQQQERCHTLAKKVANVDIDIYFTYEEAASKWDDVWRGVLTDTY